MSSAPHSFFRFPALLAALVALSAGLAMAREEKDALEKERARQATSMLAKRKLADALVSEGVKQYQRGDWLEAARNFRLALEVEPNHGGARKWLDDMSGLLDREVGPGPIFREERNRALILHQVQLASISANIQKGRQLFDAERFDKAIEEFQKALERIRWLPNVYNVKGYKNEAQAYIEASKKAKLRAKQLEEGRMAQVALQFEEANKRRELQRRSEEIYDLAKEAQKMFDRQLYGDALRVLDKILYLDPFNENAKSLRGITKRARDQMVERDLRDEWNYFWGRAMTDVQMALVPQSGTFDWPSHSDWELVKARALTVLRQEKKEKPREVREIENALDQKRVNLIFSGGQQTIPEVIDFLKTETGVNMVITPEASSQSADTPVNIHATEMRLRAALDLLMDIHNLDYYIDNGAVIIGTKEEVTKDSSELRIYDVRDLMGTITDFPGRTVNLNTQQGQGGAGGAGGGLLGGGGGEGEASGFTGESLVELIKANVRNDSWDEPANITFHNNGSLLVKNQPRVLDDVEILLADLRRSAGMLVTIEARFVDIADNFLEDIGVDLRGLGDRLGDNGLTMKGKGTNNTIDDVLLGSPAQPQGVGTTSNLGAYFDDNSDGDIRGRVENLFDSAVGDPSIIDRTGGASLQFTYIDDTQLQAILRAVQKSDRITLVTAPRITVFNTQRANVTLVNQVAYISDFEIEIAQGAFLADPVVSSVQDGIVMDVRPTISADRKYITLELQPTTAELVRPIPTISTSLGANNQIVNIETPELTIRRVKTTVTVPDGGTIVIGGLKKAREETVESGIPWFSNLPIIRFLFSRNAKAVLRQNIIILVKARISILEELEERQY